MKRFFSYLQQRKERWLSWCATRPSWVKRGIWCVIALVLVLLLGWYGYSCWSEKEKTARMQELLLLNEAERKAMLRQQYLDEETKRYLKEIESEEAAEQALEDDKYRAIIEERQQKLEAQRQAEELEKQKRIEKEQEEARRLQEEQQRREAEEAEQRRIQAESARPQTVQNAQQEEESPDQEAQDKEIEGPEPNASIMEKLLYACAEAEDEEMFRQYREEAIQCLISGLPDELLQTDETMQGVVALLLLEKACGWKNLYNLMHEKNGKKFIKWLLRNKKQPLLHLMRYCTLYEVDAGKLPVVTERLYRLWEQTDSKVRSKYLKLMIAFAIVDDHVERGNAIPRYSLYSSLYKRNENHELFLDISKLEVRFLIHVADLQVSEKDWRWFESLEMFRYSANVETKLENLLRSLVQTRRRNERTQTIGMSMEDKYNNGCNYKDSVDLVVKLAKMHGLPVKDTQEIGCYDKFRWITTWKKGNLYAIAHPESYVGGQCSHPFHKGPVGVRTLELPRGVETESNLFFIIDRIMVADLLRGSHVGEKNVTTWEYLANQYPDVHIIWMRWEKELESSFAGEADAKKYCRSLKSASKKSADLSLLYWDAQKRYDWGNLPYPVKRTKMTNEFKRIKRICRDGRFDVVYRIAGDISREMAEHDDFRRCLRFTLSLLNDYDKQPRYFYAILRQFLMLSDKFMKADARDWAKAANEITRKVDKCNVDDKKRWLTMAHYMERCELLILLYELAGQDNKGEKQRECLTKMKESYEKGECRWWWRFE